MNLKVITEASSIRRNARIVDELDVTSAFATLAVEMNFVRPEVDERCAPRYLSESRSL